MRIRAYKLKMDKYIRYFRALADRTRLRIIYLLVRADKELCICEIEKCLNIAQYNVSRHARELKIAGLIKEKKTGKICILQVMLRKRRFSQIPVENNKVSF